MIKKCKSCNKLASKKYSNKYCSGECQSQARLLKWRREGKTCKAASPVKHNGKLINDLNFYNTREWIAVRYQALRLSEHRCLSCGSSPNDGIRLHVDHIKPRSVRPDLSLNINNLQVLCEQCNLGKSNKYSDDFRPATSLLIK